MIMAWECFLGAFPGYLEYHFDGLQFFFKDISYFTCVVNVLHACMHVRRRHAWFLGKSEEVFGSPGTGVQDGCEPPGGCTGIQDGCEPLDGCWELSLHHL